MLSFLGFQRVMAQMLDDRNLYDIWLAAEKHIDAGRFDNAKLLLEGRPNVPEFQQKLKTTKILHTHFQAGERFFKAKNYKEALAQYSKYRSIERDIHVAIFDTRIETCLKQLERIQTRKLDDVTRVVAGFEWAYKGEKQLSVLDTAAASKSFAKARQLGGSRNSTLREQYQEGLQAVKSLRVWGERYTVAKTGNDPDKTLDLLKEYRLASRYIIGGLESEIKKMEEKSTVAPEVRIMDLANKCQITDLIYLIQTNKAAFADSDEMLMLINEFMQMENDINSFKRGPGNYEFIKSGYESLIRKGTQVPKIGLQLGACAQKQFAEYLIELAQISEKAGDQNNLQTRYQEAIKYLVQTKQIAPPQMLPQVEESLSRLAGKLTCDEIRADFKKWADTAQMELANCRVVQAKKAWDEGLATLIGCEANSSKFLEPYRPLANQLAARYLTDSLYTSYNTQAQKAMDALRCEDAKELFQKMVALDVCNVAIRDSAYAKNILRIAACERTSCFTGNSENAAQSIKNKEWKQAYVLYKSAYECGNFAQKERISEILLAIECDAYPEKCSGRGPKLSVEPTARLLANKPKYTEEGVGKATGYGYFTSAGLQLTFLSYESPLDFVLGVEYFRTEYQSLQIIQSKEYTSSEFDISGAAMHVAVKVHKPNANASKFRPYLKGGVELLMPMSYARIDLENVSNSTNNRLLLKKQSLNALGGVGVEIQRKKFGFFVEATLGYNFSGLYNSNFITSSGSKGITESYFRMAGIRTGIRFW
ncbi:hypothetical protein [Arundinibacter roseus]|uniref:Uncharacterized protein n=1 Tax=Arundinibacter roseus TaxID=2070510 RepID=A0A4R4KI10_9BACT|nr:hypothetical protein [Arundinibacter roseus]TDB67483.1 hypothetical protein EZE20_05920 [Arundinibacter roseus]